MDKCPKCGAEVSWTDERSGLSSSGFGCSTFITYMGTVAESVECVKRQLAAANEKLAESARLATVSAQLADSLAKDLAAANERNAGWEKAAESWFASPEAAQRLEGYRELALKVNAAELALAAANERAGRLEGEFKKAQGAWFGRETTRFSDGSIRCAFDPEEGFTLNEYFEGGA